MEKRFECGCLFNGDGLVNFCQAHGVRDMHSRHDRSKKDTKLVPLSKTEILSKIEDAISAMDTLARTLPFDSFEDSLVDKAITSLQRAQIVVAEFASKN